MSEQQKQSPELEQTSEQQSLASLIKDLSLPDEVIGAIEKLDNKDNKEICILMLEEIRNDLMNGKILSPADASDKAKNTLREYKINVIELTNKDAAKENFINKNAENEKSFKELSENLTKVKSLDPIVGDELEKAKKEKPNLPPELTKAITDKTGVTVQNLDDVTTKGGEQQQNIKNMIDTYYLLSISSQLKEKIKSGKSETEMANIESTFETLRNSADHLDIPHSTAAKDVEKLIPDKSDKTQKAVVDTVTSLTRDNPNTLITRTGDKLNWESPDGKKYEIDMAVRPPRLSKSKNGLSISYEKQPENPELESTQESVKDAQNILNERKNGAQNQLKNGGFNRDLEKYSITELQEFLNNNSVFPNFSERFRNTIKDKNGLQVLHTELSVKAILASNDMESKTLSYMQSIVDGKIAQHKTGVGDISIASEDEKATMKYVDILTSESTKDGLEKYIAARKDLEIKEKKLASIRTPGVEDFDRDATETLNTLIADGYDKLGQEKFNELLEVMNFHNNKSVEPINLDQNPKLSETQRQSLRNMSEDMLQRFQKKAQESGKTAPTNFRELWQGISNGLRDNNFRDKNWNTRKKREQFLYKQETKKSEPTS